MCTKVSHKNNCNDVVTSRHNDAPRPHHIVARTSGSLSDICVQVSWIRVSDVSLLAVGGYTYTSDLRLESRHEAGTRDWDLIIRNVSRGDGGHYECQVNIVCTLTMMMCVPVSGLHHAPHVHHHHSRR